MIWWFLILGVSSMVVVCVALALFLHLRSHLQKAHAHEGSTGDVESGRRADSIQR
jgi:hypothetical protein